MIYNRIKEFLKQVDISKQIELPKHKKTFYEEIYLEIENLKEKINRTSSYGNFLVYDDKLNKIQNDILLLDNIQLSGTSENEGGNVNELVEFKGIKEILKRKVVECVKLINSKKKKEILNLKAEKSNKYQNSNNQNIQHESNKYQNSNNQNIQRENSTLKTSNYDSCVEENTGIHLKTSSNLLFQELQLEKENKQILQGQGYAEAKLRLKQIDQVQTLIRQHLLTQDERIDKVCEVTHKTSDIYTSINEMSFGGSGSFFRRFVFLFIVCLTILLIYVHLYHNRF